jgi:3-oxoacyl-[acyl-carrier protein] reductase
MELKDKTAIITGAAGGIGRAVAELFAREGATLVLVDINKKSLENLAERLGPKVKILSLAIDVSNEKQVRNVVEVTFKKFGKIDIMVNGAAICKMISISEIEVEEWDHVMAVNLRSVFLFCKEVFPYMKQKRSGNIINIASASGKIGGIAAGAHYSASKAGVICFTKSMALNAAPYRINVNAVCPGPITTEMTDVWGEEMNKNFAEKIPFKEYGQPEDVAEAILFLASGRSRYITGEILDVNGGMVMD